MDASTQNDAAIQERVFAYLTDPAVHPGTLRIDTHAASVFLEGDRALKIKRAVHFPFLDYSTLEKRKAACEEEIRINRPFAPRIYRGVVAITQDPDGLLSVDGKGVPIEFAVEMSRFDEQQTLDHLSKAGPLDAKLASDIADAISVSHAIAPGADAARWIKSIPALIDSNTAGLQNGARFPASEIEDLGRTSHEIFACVRGLLEERGRSGHVRRCHGDLHLANIVLIADRPVLFDAIEFDPTIASVDVLYDLAFPLMDLLRYGQPLAANVVLNRYLGTTSVENLEGLAALALFLSMRAAIRAQVLIARLERPNADHAGSLADAHEYFKLAQSLIRPPAPRLIAIGGLSGTGKSVLARALAPFVAPQPGAVVFRSDVLRKQLFGVGETERLPADAYRREAGEQVYATLLRRANSVLAHGHSAIVDAVFAQEDERTAVAKIASELRVPLSAFFLVADLAIRQARVGHRQGDASDATPEVAALQEQYSIGSVGWTIIDASGTPEQTLEQCRSRIADKGQAI
ncbi:MAG: AAA family ATPase [Bradyrhizobium sp.]|uniref:bifunctional aminoglycoside phosphotransferase/ATP-binding protein n=1 Tax=Bradyrhizobium sp. TaxID=376 RepID=UPI0025BB3EF2|nr:bifunctional aminoglycoside phosphotransferase/ATP-binding protein [Bradyrhizobium sp.]MBI5261306.1 AAA family ATPase [Bradyrhizobium sp.]